MIPRRLFLPNLASGLQLLSQDEVRYAIRVLRLDQNALVRVFDGAGSEADATLNHTDDGWGVQVADTIEKTGSVQDFSLWMPVPKASRADWIVEKLAELGVPRLVWMNTKHSVVVAEKDSSKWERWERLALAAARQSRQATLMHIDGPFDLDTALADDQAHVVFGDPESDVRWVEEASNIDTEAEVRWLLGPEGGFSEDEQVQLRGQAKGVRLGAPILRMETAAVVAAGVWAGSRCGTTRALGLPL